jgi:hypothetical protein
VSDIDYTPEQLELPFTITIPLTQGYSTVIDATDADLAAVKWHTDVQTYTCYAVRTWRVDGRLRDFFIHRIILARILGRELIKGEMCDHEDGNGLNNQRYNLRLATHAENNHNRRRGRTNTSGFKGVSWSKAKRKWQAVIMFNNKQKHLGYFTTPELAHTAYCEAATELFGEFARFE